MLSCSVEEYGMKWFFYYTTKVNILEEYHCLYENNKLITFFHINPVYIRNNRYVILY
jgi:hypothetical protein